MALLGANDGDSHHRGILFVEETTRAVPVKPAPAKPEEADTT